MLRKVGRELMTQRGFMSEIIWLDGLEQSAILKEVFGVSAVDLSDWVLGRSTDAPDLDQQRVPKSNSTTLTFIVSGCPVEERANTIARALGRQCLFVDRADLLMKANDGVEKTAAIVHSARALHIKKQETNGERSFNDIPIDWDKLDRLIYSEINHFLVEQTGRDPSRIGDVGQHLEQLVTFWQDRLNAADQSLETVNWKHLDDTLELPLSEFLYRIRKVGDNTFSAISTHLLDVSAIIIPASTDARIQLSERYSTEKKVTAIIFDDERALAERLGHDGLRSLRGSICSRPNPFTGACDEEGLRNRLLIY